MGTINTGILIDLVTLAPASPVARGRPRSRAFQWQRAGPGDRSSVARTLCYAPRCMSADQCRSTPGEEGGTPNSWRTFSNTSCVLTGVAINRTCNSDLCFLRIGTRAFMLMSATSRWIGRECTRTTSNTCAQSASRTWKPSRCKQSTRRASNPSSSRATRTVGWARLCRLVIDPHFVLRENRAVQVTSCATRNKEIEIVQ